MPSVAGATNGRAPSAASSTERGQLMEYFCEPINAGRVGVRYNGRPFQPISMARMGKVLEADPHERPLLFEADLR